MAQNIFPVLLLTLALAGCAAGSEKAFSRAAVRGEVTLNGEPLTEGVVRFIPLEGTPGPKTSALVADGEFTLTDAFGPPIGTHRIEIEATDRGVAPDDEAAITQLKTTRRRPDIPVVRIPAVYNVHSRLQAEVTAEGPNEFRFELISRQKAPSRAAAGPSK